MTSAARIEPIEQATGRTWDAWLAFMERAGAKDLSHKQIAEVVAAELAGKIDNPGWWAQSVTVAYEQQTGRRLPGQLADGTFQLSVSKATRLGMRELMDAWEAFAASDKQVLDGLASEPRVSGTDKRITWRAKAKDGSSVVVTSEPKKTWASLVIAQSGVPTLEENAAAKERWTEIVARFVAGLSD